MITVKKKKNKESTQTEEVIKGGGGWSQQVNGISHETKRIYLLFFLAFVSLRFRGSESAFRVGNSELRLRFCFCFLFLCFALLAEVLVRGRPRDETAFGKLVVGSG